MTRSRTVRTAAAIATVMILALALAACGGDDDGDGGGGDDGASATTATTDGAGTTTTAAAGTTTTAPREATVALYFLRGEDVGVVHRTLTVGSTPGTAALEALVGGPAEDEAAIGFGTAIPAGTRLLGLTIEDGVATADLSGEYDDGGGSLSMTERLAEVVFTLTQFPTVDGVRFELDGEPVTAFGGEGIVLDEPVDRADFAEVTPMILVESPAPFDTVTSPIEITGVNNTFEATVEFRLEARDGDLTAVLAEGFTTGAGPTGEWGAFTGTLDFDAGTTGTAEGTLVVFESSAADGSEINVVEIPVRFAA